MALTDTFVRQIKHSGKAAGDKHADGGGMYLHVTGAGKYWRMAYRYAGKQKTLALGVYPAVTLAQARKARDNARELLAQDPPIDPSAAKREAKIAHAVATANTFEAVARELHATKTDGWSPGHAARWMERMKRDIFPLIGRFPLAQIKAPALLDALKRVEGRGAGESAKKLRQYIGQVFKYGIQTGRCEYDPSAALSGALKPVLAKHYPSITDPAKAGQLLRAMWNYTGTPSTNALLRLSPLDWA